MSGMTSQAMRSSWGVASSTTRLAMRSTCSSVSDSLAAGEGATAGAGGAAFLVGPAEESLAVFEGSTSYVTDTADFWRRQHEHYPAHAGRFTGEPGYFRHVLTAASEIMPFSLVPRAAVIATTGAVRFRRIS
jgi:hydroxymethylglutaryl-CoA synthase